MTIKFVSKNFGSQTIDTENYNPSIASVHSPIFQMVEYMFDEWYESRAANDREIIAMYNGDGDQPAIYSKKGAIRQGIETVIEIAEESKKPSMVVNSRDLMKMDIESAFE